MLDQDTKRKIDAARDILVGIVPDPKAQVNQITIALMYKFMDDMDRASAQAGGKASFLAGDFSQYSWAKLMDKRLSSAARMDLYVRAIGEMPKNPGIPQLFRDIFKEAFLPFRNARTLNLFLTEIDGFDYDHSENLGNAFEYLLSIMGAQGDAGQFRTPRHIIDFMVEVVSPQKNENILDPACGTAGFLISAYKYIFRQKPALTPQEKTKLTKNIVGYDISPDMVKLALVNMFLHRFVAPKIHEYDALTSEERWGRDFDVILANPPFMTPRGGIEPHTQFRIRANRAEVLFVDYIAEHLTLKGRAGIVVPEGIIFQTANAYKNLRKALVEEWGLYAVASLPNGVFNPYAGVKTSILFINRDLAKRTGKILFVKAENDGFDLGAQRRPIEKNDLPACLAALQLWQKNQTVAKNCNVGFAVEKAKIAESGEYNLTAERYRETEVYKTAKCKMVELGEILDLCFGERITKKNAQGTKYPVYGGGGESFMTDNYNREDSFVVSRFAMSENCVRYVSGKFWLMDSGATFLVKKNYKANLNDIFIGNLLMSMQSEIYSLARGHAQKNMDTKAIKKIKIPLPPLSVQKEIVAEIKQWQKVIDGAKQVTENWKPHIRIAPEWPMTELEKLCKILKGTSVTKKNITAGKIPVIAGGRQPAYYHNKANRKGETVTVSGSGAYAGFVNFFKISIFASDCVTIQSADEKKLLTKFSFYALKQKQKEIYKLQSGMGQPHVYAKDLKKLKIPLPPLSKQKEIVAAMEAEQKPSATAKN